MTVNALFVACQRLKVPRGLIYGSTHFPGESFKLELLFLCLHGAVSGNLLSNWGHNTRDRIMDIDLCNFDEAILVVTVAVAG